MFEIRCLCGKLLRVPPTALGNAGKCPFCGAKLRLIAPHLGAEEAADFADRLVIQDGPAHMGQQLLLAGPGPIEVGKLADKDIQLEDQRVSRTHCRLVRAGTGWRIEDNRSTNGIFVNDQRVSGSELADGDLVRIGGYVLKYVGAARMAPAAGTASGLGQPMQPPPRAALASAPRAMPNSAMAAVAPPPSAPAEEDEPEADSLLDDANLYALAEGDTVDVPAAPEPAPTAPAPVEAGGPVCPACGKALAASAKICVTCGIDVKTGRAIVIADEGNLDTIYSATESVLTWLSWIIPAGLYPMASEAFGTRRPYVTWGTVALTALITVWFWSYEWTDSPKMVQMKNYMLWAGTTEPPPDELCSYYFSTSYGDTQAFEAKLDELSRKDAKPAPRRLRSDDEEETFKAEHVVAAHKSLPPERRCIGQYRPSQLIMCAFLHGDIMHLVGNMIFLLVIGSRVNAMVGNIATALLYPLLAVASGLIYMASAVGSPAHPLVGASGAIAGLAGLYLMLSPINKVHMVFWCRLGLLWRFRLSMKMFAVRGFWVLLFYFGFDVLYTVLRVKDNVAHWAHLGGLITGAAIGLALLLARAVNARGGDLLTAVLGRNAWALVGKPNLTRKAPLELVP